MSKQNSIDWLIDKVHSDEYTKAFGQTYISIALILEALDMHRQEIEEAFNYGQTTGYLYRATGGQVMSKEQYYNQLYGDDENR